MRAIDLVGQRFGRLLVMERGANSPGGKCRFWCVCDCGVKKEILSTSLMSGKNKSCGCYRVEFGRRIGASNLTHKMIDTSEYQCWANMKDRCHNSRNKSYRRYGGRGIQVCERWRDSFESFLEDMGRKPGPELSIERKDNNGPYEKRNCMWATRSQQQRNKNPFKHQSKDAAVRAKLYQDPQG
jgi:hypothetical protein